MGSKLYVANLGADITESALTTMFEPYGAVEFVKLILDHATGRPKGYGFVKMKSDQEARAAIAALNGQDVGGKGGLQVAEASNPAEGGRSSRNQGGRRSR